MITSKIRIRKRQAASGRSCSGVRHLRVPSHQQDESQMRSKYRDEPLQRKSASPLIFISVLRFRRDHYLPGDAKAINYDSVSLGEKSFLQRDLDLPAIAESRKEPFGFLRSFNPEKKREAGKGCFGWRLLATAVRRHDLRGTDAECCMKYFFLHSRPQLGRVWTVAKPHHEESLSFNRPAIERDRFFSAPVKI